MCTLAEHSEQPEQSIVGRAVKANVSEHDTGGRRVSAGYTLSGKQVFNGGVVPL